MCWAVMWGPHDRTCGCRMRRVTVQLAAQCVSCLGAASRACHMLTGFCGTPTLGFIHTAELNHDSVLLPEPTDWGACQVVGVNVTACSQAACSMERCPFGEALQGVGLCGRLCGGRGRQCGAAGPCCCCTVCN